MNDIWTTQSWKVFQATLAIGLALLALFILPLLVYDLWYLDLQCDRAVGRFHDPTSDLSQKGSSLAELLRLQGWLTPKECADKGIQLFYSELSPDQQVAFFEADYVADSDLIELVPALYITQADVDNPDQSTRVLTAMVDALDDVDETEQVADLKNEINGWLEARHFVEEENYSDSLKYYSQTIQFNKNNPATLYERARVHAKLNEPANALSDLENVVRIANNSNGPAETIIEQSRDLIESDSELMNALNRAPESEYPNLKQLISQPTATIRVSITETHSPTALPPTETMTPLFTMSPSFTPQPEGSPSATLIATVTLVSVTPTGMVTPTIDSTVVPTVTTGTPTITGTITASTTPTITATITPTITPTIPPTITVTTTSVAPSESPSITPEPILPTQTPIPTAVPTTIPASPTIVPTRVSATQVRTVTPTATFVPPSATFVSPTATFVSPTATFVPPTATFVPPTATFVPPTVTFVPPTATFVPPTATFVPPTATFVPPTATFVPPTATFVPPTATFVPPTATFVPPTATFVPPTATNTPVPPTATTFAGYNQAPVPITPNDQIRSASVAFEWQWNGGPLRSGDQFRLIGFRDGQWLQLGTFNRNRRSATVDMHLFGNFETIWSWQIVIVDASENEISPRSGAVNFSISLGGENGPGGTSTPPP